MKRLLRILGILLAAVVLAAAGAVLYITRFLPDIPVPAGLKVALTPERVARGSYLANHVCACMDCHSTRDWKRFSGPLVEGTLGSGGELFDERMNFPGSFAAKNITPHALREWSDGEIHRAIASGVSRDGTPLFPVMPYPNYGKMARDDIESIIAYLRTLAPIKSSPPKSKAAFPVNIFLHLMPQPAQPATPPDPRDSVAHGAYLANAAGCAECHTRMEKGQRNGRPFAGGFAFAMPGGATLRSTNITPHPVTGIGAWTKQQFLDRFKAFSRDKYTPPAVDSDKGAMQTVMPWMMYAGMTEQDLGAIYDYLRTVPAVDAQIERWTPAAK